MADKRRERFYLEQLRAALPDFPPGHVEAGPEPPDFVIRSADRVVGIEMTEFYLPPQPGERRHHQEEQSLKNHAVRRACEIHAGSGGPGLYVQVFFHRPFSLTKNTLERFAGCLAQAVGEVPAPTFGEQSTSVPWQRLPVGVSSISLHGGLRGQDRLWQAGNGGWVAPIGPELIQPVIAKKVRKCQPVRKTYAELWLVIVGDDFSDGAPAELTRSAAEHVYANQFNRVFWLRPHVPRAHELGQPAPDLDEGNVEHDCSHLRSQKHRTERHRRRPEVGRAPGRPRAPVCAGGKAGPSTTPTSTSTMASAVPNLRTVPAFCA